MRCRTCNELIDMENGTCPFCGFVVPEAEQEDLGFIDDVKKDLDRLDRSCKVFKENIELMNGRVQKFEQSVHKRITAWAEWKEEGPPTVPDKSPDTVMPDDGWTLPAPEAPATPKTVTREIKKPVAKVVNAVKEVKQKSVRKQEQLNEDSFELRLGQKWLLVIGIVTMLLGVGYFLKYSIDQGWIGPAGRVAMAYAWGTALMIGGEYFRRSEYWRFGYSLSAAGAATLYFGTFAAHHLYGLFPMAISYLLMIFVTLALCTLSVRFSAFWLAVLGMLGGFGTPFMLGLGEGRAFILGYITVLNLGFLTISYRKRWPALEALGLLFTYVLFGWWLTEHWRTFTFIPVVGFTALFAALYHVVPFATAYLGGNRQGKSLYAPLLVLINTVFSLIVCTMVFGQHLDDASWMGLPILLHAGALAAMGVYLSLKRPDAQGALAVLFVGSSLLAAVAVPIMVTGYWMTLGWVLLALLFQQVGFGLGRRELLGGAYVLLMVATAKFILHDYNDIFLLDMNRMVFRLGYTAHMLTRWACTAGVLVPLLLTALSALRRREQGPYFLSTERNDHAPLYGLFAISLFIVFNVENITLFTEYLPAARFAVVSVLWTVFSVGLMLIGFIKNSSAARFMALVLFFVTLGKVFFVDMAHVGTPWRILSFIVLGTVLTGTSYLYYRFKDRLIEAMGRGRIDSTEARV